MPSVKQIIAEVQLCATLGPNQKTFVVKAIQEAEERLKLKAPRSPRKISNAKHLVTLEEWEERNSKLTSKRNNLGGWATGNGLDCHVIMDMANEFRQEMLAKGKQYANFRMAFITYLTKGYLSKPLSACIKKQATSVDTKGVTL